VRQYGRLSQRKLGFLFFAWSTITLCKRDDFKASQAAQTTTTRALYTVMTEIRCCYVLKVIDVDESIEILLESARCRTVSDGSRLFIARDSAV